MGVKISELPIFSVPLTGSELVPIVQNSITSQGSLSALAAPLSANGLLLARSEVSSLTGNWQNTYTTFESCRSNYDKGFNSYTTFNATSACFARIDTANTFSCNNIFPSINITGNANFCGNADMTGGCLIAAQIKAGYQPNTGGRCNYSSTIAGFYNEATGCASVIGTGNYNRAKTTYSGVFAGHYNTVTCFGVASTVLGGRLNTVNSYHSSIINGCGNTLTSTASSSSIIAGDGITATNADTAYAQNICALGDITTNTFTALTANFTQTIVSTTSALSVLNNGSGPAIVANQTGNNDIIDFQDDGTSAFFIENGGNVGIGTTTPNEKLTVSGNISATGGLNVGGNSFFTGNVIDFDAGTSINFAGQPATFDNAVSFNNGATFTTEDLCVTDANVGIGTTTPNEKLTVSGNISATGDITTSNINVGDLIRHTGDPNTYISFFPNIVDIGAGINDGPGIQISTGVVIINEDSDPDMDLCVRHDGGTALFADGNNGNIGINTTNPNETLTVSGNLSATGKLLVGNDNIAECLRATVVGGCQNCSNGCDSFIGGGCGNSVNDSDFSSIVAGTQNCITSCLDGAFIGGGQNNTVCGSGSIGSVVGGCGNILRHGCSAIVGGTDTTSVSANMLHVNRLYACDLPTSDPGVTGVVWNDSGTLKISI